MAYDVRGDPVLGTALDYWDRKRGARAMPRKRDIDATEIAPKILPHLQIIDVINGGAGFRFRLVGSVSVQAYGADYTGKCPEDMFSDDRPARIKSVYRSVCQNKIPFFYQSKYQTPRDTALLTLRVYMPLSDNGLAVSHILGAVVFEVDSHLNQGAWGPDALIDPSSHYMERVVLERETLPCSINTADERAG